MPVFVLPDPANIASHRVNKFQLEATSHGQITEDVNKTNVILFVLNTKSKIMMTAKLSLFSSGSGSWNILADELRQLSSRDPKMILVLRSFTHKAFLKQAKLNGYQKSGT